MTTHPEGKDDRAPRDRPYSAVARPMTLSEQPGRTLTEIARRTLRDEILDGHLAPGTRLRLQEIALRLDMSVMPVREAILALQGEGLVEQTPHKGASVRLVSVEDYADLYRNRIRIERIAVQDAAAHMQAADHARLLNVLLAFEQAIERGDVSLGFKLHEEFHFGIYGLSGSTWLLRAIRPLWDAAEHYQRLRVSPDAQPGAAVDEHKAIIDACLLGDADRAGFAFEAHLRHTSDLATTGLDLTDATTQPAQGEAGAVRPARRRRPAKQRADAGAD
jgi:DNA-binding GntR family transcriptional regulator